jgi:hypothetical protein
MSGPEAGFLSRWAKRKAEVREKRTDLDDAAGRGSPVPAPAATAVAPVHATPSADRSISTSGLSVPPSPPDALRSRLEAGARTATPSAAPSAAPMAAEPPPLPTLADVALLTRQSDYTPFMRPGVDMGVRNAAMKKLFTDPHFNVMDGLDTYIDDYGKPDPIPLSMLRQMNQSKALGLFDAEDDEAAGVDAQQRSAPAADATAADAPAADVKDAAAAPAPVDRDNQPVVACSLLDDSQPLPAGVPEAGPDDDPDLRLQQDDGAGRRGAAPGPRA